MKGLPQACILHFRSLNNSLGPSRQKAPLAVLPAPQGSWASFLVYARIRYFPTGSVARCPTSFACQSVKGASSRLVNSR